MNRNLSIIIPCYNCERTLEEAVNSIYKQNLRDFEIVIVDDNSTDSTSNIIKNLSNKYREIRQFRNENNLGGGATRNRAVRESRNDIIFCLDSDDVLPPNTLNKMIDLIIDKKIQGVCFEKSIKFNNNNPNNIARVDLSPYKKNEKIPVESLFLKKMKFHPLMVNFMYSKDAFNKISGYPARHDFDTQGFGFRFLCNGLEAITCPGTEYLHRINFKESYYLKNYKDGKINYNWKIILLEHYFIFNRKTLDFIKKFNCQDFTINLMDELKKMDQILVPDVNEKIKKEHPKLKYRFEINPVKRSSVKGYYFRLKSRMRKLIK